MIYQFHEATINRTENKWSLHFQCSDPNSDIMRIAIVHDNDHLEVSLQLRQSISDNNFNPRRNGLLAALRYRDLDLDLREYIDNVDSIYAAELIVRPNQLDQVLDALADVSIEIPALLERREPDCYSECVQMIQRYAVDPAELNASVRGPTPNNVYLRSPTPSNASSHPTTPRSSRLFEDDSMSDSSSSDSEYDHDSKSSSGRRSPGSQSRQ
jgi:hypothetical protein